MPLIKKASSGPSLSIDAALRAHSRGEFVWHTSDGMLLTLDLICDSHLLNIERFLLGRGKLARVVYNHDEWRRAYKIIRDEIDQRGLQLLSSDNAPPALNEERHDRT